MLILSRKLGEKIVLPVLGVTITVQAISGGVVRLGITAPEEVAVHREELWQRLQNQDIPLNHSGSGG